MTGVYAVEQSRRFCSGVLDAVEGSVYGYVACCVDVAL